MALIAHWPLNGDTNDISGNGLHGTPTNITYGNGKIGLAGEFNGSNSYITTSHQLKETMAFSFSAWVKTSSTATQTIVCSRTVVGNGFSIFILGQKIRFDSGASWQWSTGYTVPLNQWVHITVTRSSSGRKLFVNGSLVASTTAPGDMLTLGSIMSFGASQANGTGWGNYLSGNLNDLRLYDTALTDMEIQEIARAKILHYTFDDMQEPTENKLDFLSYERCWNGGSSNVCQLRSIENNHSIKIEGTASVLGSSGYAYIYPYYAVENDIYTISATFKNNNIRESRIDMKLRDDSNGAELGGGVSYYVQPGETVRLSSTANNPVTTGRVTTSFSIYTDTTGYVNIEMFDVQLEQKDHATPFTEYIREPGIISDLSGYGFDGIQNGTPLIWSKDSPVSNGSAYFNNSTLRTGKIFHDNINQEWTLSAWVKLDPVTVGNQQLNNFNLGNRIIHSAGNRRGLLYANSGTNDHYVYTESNGIPENEWFHLTYVYNKNGLVCDAYFNGELNASSTNFTSSDVPSGFAAETIFGTNLKGYMNDIRLYATELSAKDIKDIYETRAEISNSGTLQTYDFKQRRNLLQSVNQAIKDKQFKDGLSSYTQANTNVTLTDRGYRIYRPPNVNPTDNGNTMWGGLRINMTDIPGGIPLIKGRSYRLIINTNGKTSNSSSGSSKFTNNMGWGGGGLNPTPITIGREWVQIPINFNGKHDIIWEFKIEDDIYKVCTSSYSSFVAGNTYPSYNHLQVGWGYQDTGSIGTEIYITGIYLYDITDDDSIGISNKGIGTFDEYSTVGITDGLVGYWPLDKDLRDFSGNNYTAINYGGIFDSESTYFNGSSYINLPYGGNINPSTNPQSFSMMVKKTASTDTIFFTTSQSGDASARMYIRSGTNDGLNLAIQANSTNGTEYANSLSLNNWHYIVVTMDGSNAKLYLDGSLLNTKTYTSYLFNQNIRVGQHDGSYSFTGNIKNIKIFNRALTPEEIAIEYNTMFKNEVQIHESGVLYAKDLKQY